MIEKDNLDISDALAAGLPVTHQEIFIKGVYSSIDKAADGELDRLRSEADIIPTCKLGCCYCCRYHIVTNIAEAHTLAQYVKRELSADQKNSLLMRMQHWHEWYNGILSRYLSADGREQPVLSGDNHFCPLLVDGECSVYPVRPVVCRTHYVCSVSPCRCEANTSSAEGISAELSSVVTAASPFSMEIKDYVECAGLNFSRSIMLLPHWLAIEMGWNFDNYCWDL